MTHIPSFAASIQLPNFAHLFMSVAEVIVKLWSYALSAVHLRPAVERLLQIPIRRITSTTDVPISPCFSAVAIYSSVCLVFFMFQFLARAFKGPENSLNMSAKAGGRRLWRLQGGVAQPVCQHPGGRQPANTAIRPQMVMVVAPEPQHRASVAKRQEQRLVEALVAKAAGEALDVAVLLRVAGRDVVTLDGSFVRPSQDRQTGQLVPLSLSVISGGTPLAAMMASSSRATLAPGSDHRRVFSRKGLPRSSA